MFAEMDDTVAVEPQIPDDDTRSEYRIVIPDEFKDGMDELGRLYKRLVALWRPDDDDDGRDFILPHKESFRKTIELLQAVSYRLMQHHTPIPVGYAVTNDDGGIRIEWWHDHRYCVTLSIGPDREYVFVKLDPEDAGKVNQRVLTSRLASQLLRLATMQHESA